MSDDLPQDVVRIGDGLYLINRCARVIAYPLAASTSTPASSSPKSGVTLERAQQLLPGLKMIGSVVQDTPRTRGIIAGSYDDRGRGVADSTTTAQDVNAPQSIASFRPTGATVEISDLRIQFDIEKSLTKHPNKCQVTITNLSDQTRSVFEKQPVAVSLEAGHDNVFHSLFFGDQIFARSEYKETDWDTLVQVGDGSRAFNFARIPSGKSYKPGTPVLDVLRDVAASMGQELPRNIMVSDALRGQFSAGMVIQGPSRDELTRLLAPFGYSWSTQDGRLQILSDSDVADGQAILVQESTGLIGSPAYGTPHKNGKPPTLHVKMLLYPGLRPGLRIKVVSRTANGLFRIEKVVHKGDTHGTDWESVLEVLPTTAGSAEAAVAPPREISFARYKGIFKNVGNVANHL